MILKSITLQNFRSYGSAPTKIDLERGVLLFEGDIGSGKSSILYAIEFALFGLGDIEARHVLRSSATISKVELDFEAENEEYKVVRTLEKKKGTKAFVTGGWLSEKGAKLSEYSTTELKSRILQILNFKEKPGKASSRIFRFAVFTPQELMRDVLSQKPDERIETLRRAFGIEDYSFATENAESVAKSLRSRAEVHSELSKTLPAKEYELEKLGKALSEDRARLDNERIALEDLNQKIEESVKDLADLEEIRDRIKSLETLVPQLETSLKDSQGQLVEAKYQLQVSKKELSEIQKAKLQVSSLKADYEEYARARERSRRLERLRDEQLELERKISGIQSKIAAKESSLKAELSSRRDDLQKCRATIDSFDRELGELKTLQKRYEELEEKLGAASGVQSELDFVRSEIASERALRGARKSEIELQQEQFKKLDGLQDATECPVCRQKLDQVHLSLVSKEFRDRLESLRSRVHAADANLSDLAGKEKDLENECSELEEIKEEYQSIGKKLAALENTVMLREKSGKELVQFTAKIEDLETSLKLKGYAGKAETDELASLESRKKEIAGPLAELAETRNRIQYLEKSQVEKNYLTAQTKVARENQVLELGAKIEERLSGIESSISKKSQEIVKRKIELEELEPAMLRYSKLKDSIESLKEERENHRSKHDALSATVELNSTNLGALTSEVSNLKESSRKATLFKGLSSWIETLFIPTVAEIETYVLDSINEEFEKMFQRWFSLLVEEGDISVRIDERFTPLVEQAGYDLDVESLSGGERTAVALAYRLALNYMVRRANEAVHTNLLILDEPTEGFSKEQIYRLRNVLEELDSDQVVLVSHERDLEQMADTVYRVEKVNGESQVTALSSLN